MGTLRDAITQANASTDTSNTITFAAGLSGATISLNSALPTIGGRISNITGPGSGLLTVQRNPAGGTANFAVFYVGTDASVTIAGMKIQRGNVSGIFVNQGGSLTLSLVEVSLNTGSTGGGINNGGSVTLNATVVTANTSSGTGAKGGGIYCGSGARLIVQAQLVGGVNSKSSIYGNTSDGPGGRIYLDSNAGTTDVFDSEIVGNTAGDTTSGNGGGIYKGASSGLLTVRRSLVSTNTAQGKGLGGGIYTESSGIVISNTTMQGNSANNGGPIYVKTGARGIVLTNVTDAKNRAVKVTTPNAPNGPLGPDGPNGVGGGLYVEPGAEVEVVNTVIATNTAGDSSPDIFGVVASLGYNLIGDGTGSSGWVASGTGRDMVGTSSVPIDPKLNPLGDNGGPTWSMSFQLGSPLFQAGNPAAVDDTVDQAGNPRVVNGFVDIGALESQSAAIPSWGSTSGSGWISSGTGSDVVGDYSGPSEPIAGGSRQMLQFMQPSELQALGWFDGLSTPEQVSRI